MAQPYKIGLIGAGGIAGAHLRAFQRFPQAVQLAAICDIVEESARKRAGEVDNEPAIFTDYEKFLKEADVDAVDICVSHDQHLPVALAAFEAGKHVLLEKPMACSMDECYRLVEEGDKAGVTFMVAQCQRYMPTYRSVKRLIDAGRLGRIKAVRFDSMQDLPSFAPNGHWLCDGKKAGGGIVISVSVHRIDLMRYLVGDIVRVTGVTRRTHELFVNDAEDLAAGLLEFDNGAIGEMFATYTGFRMPWGEMFMIFGEDGTIHAVPKLGDYEGEAVMALRDTVEPYKGWGDMYSGFKSMKVDASEFPSDDCFANEVLHFADCCKTGKEPDSSGRDNLGTMKAVFGIYESVKQGTSVELAGL